jgi:hypothetical protein
MDSAKAEIRVGKGREPEQGSSCVGSTTAYTLASRDRLNLGIITKDPATIAAPARSRSDQAKATSSIQAKAVSSNAKAEFYSRERDVYNQAYDKVMSSSGTVLSTETKEKPKTYPAMHPKYEAYQMEKDAANAVIAQRARDKALADKALADKAQADKAQVDKAQADKAQADKAQAENARSANNNQAKAVNREMDKGESVPLVTRAQKQEGLKMWKDLLIQTKEYRPFQERTEEENLKEVKFLRAAMSNFRLLKLQGMDSLRHEHSEFGYLQEKYYIPKAFCMPEELFREEQLDYNVVYYKRCCSMYDYYNMLSKDNPCFVERRERRWSQAAHSSHNLPHQSERQASPAAQDKDSRSIPPVLNALAEQPRATSTHQSVRQEPPAVQDGSSRSRPPAVYPPGTSQHQAFRLTKNHPSYRPPNPSYNPFIHTRNQPIRQDVDSFQSTNPSNLDDEQRESAEKAEARRKAPRKNAPIPSDGDETNTDGESDLLFADKLLPADKQRILALEKSIRRIRSRDYSPGYSKAKVQAITAAETDRLKGLEGPWYLTGVRPPWYSDQGQAPIHYDEHQVGLIQERIERIKKHNTVMCQFEYTANKGGPGGQARR